MTASLAVLRERLAERLADLGLDLEEVHVQRAGRRELVRVVVDRDGGADLDAIAEASRAISALLDDEPIAGQFSGAYVLEVTSPGVDRPLTQPRHWRRAVGRLVEATLVDGQVVLGRVDSADDEQAVLIRADSGRVSVGLADVQRAMVQVEFSRSGEEEQD